VEQRWSAPQLQSPAFCSTAPLAPPPYRGSRWRWSKRTRPELLSSFHFLIELLGIRLDRHQPLSVPRLPSPHRHIRWPNGCQNRVHSSRKARRCWEFKIGQVAASAGRQRIHSETDDIRPAASFGASIGRVRARNQATSFTMSLRDGPAKPGPPSMRLICAISVWFSPVFSRIWGGRGKFRHPAINRPAHSLHAPGAEIVGVTP
jgi:hypothetical protein